MSQNRLIALLSGAAGFAGRNVVASEQPTPTPSPTPTPTPAASGNVLDLAAVEQEVNALEAAAGNTARAAEQKRWNDVLASDIGKAHPQACAALLSTSTMAADGVISAVTATVAAIAPAAAGTTVAPAAGANVQEQQREEGANRLGLIAANPPSGAGANKGNDNVDRNGLAEKRKATQDARNKQVTAQIERNQKRA